ncbi:hypothetical protein DL93DRAFT_1974649 [Clavulina sp. PMI_390]|nr:hypothetical protein DL93DRAFT_1974649 [Clavulina sp. PMI_390]
MSDTSGRPPTYITYEIPESTHGTIFRNSRTPSPRPSGRELSIDLSHVWPADRLFYRLYQNDAPLSSYHPIRSRGDGEGNDRVGKVGVDEIAPPRTFGGLKRAIARAEGFNAGDFQSMHAFNSTETLEDGSPVFLGATNPGVFDHSPIELVVTPGAARSTPSVPRNPNNLPPAHPPNMLESAPSLPNFPHDVELPAYSNLLIHNKRLWTVDATGFAEPRVEAGNGYRIVGSLEPPGWVRARTQGNRRPAMIFDAAGELQHPIYLIEGSPLLVDRRKIRKERGFFGSLC